MSVNFFGRFVTVLSKGEILSSGVLYCYVIVGGNATRAEHVVINIMIRNQGIGVDKAQGWQVANTTCECVDH
jgi:hypothetical protein